jgi:hypothetical protein
MVISVSEFITASLEFLFTGLTLTAIGSLLVLTIVAAITATGDKLN